MTAASVSTGTEVLRHCDFHDLSRFVAVNTAIIAPVVTTTSTILAAVKSRMVTGILIPAHLGCSGKWLFNECCCSPQRICHINSFDLFDQSINQSLLILFVLVILSVIVCLNCCTLTSSRVLLYSCDLSTAFYRINEWINQPINAFISGTSP